MLIERTNLHSSEFNCIMGPTGTSLKSCSWWVNPKCLYVKYRETSILARWLLLLLMCGGNASKAVSKSGANS